MQIPYKFSIPSAKIIAMLLFFLVVVFNFGINVALANEYTSKAIKSPIIDVNPYVANDKSTVIVFFKFNCPFCRAYHTSLREWGKTLPKGFSIQFYPVIEASETNIVSDESINALQSYWVAQRLGNNAKIDAFVDEGYSISQDEMEGDNRDRWFSALINQGFKQDSIIEAWKKEVSLGPDRIARQVHYEPKETPSLVICGKWMISPSSTSGNNALFVQLLNALVSKCADELGIRAK